MQLASYCSVRFLCRHLGFNRGSYYRYLNPGPKRPKAARPTPANRLSDDERNRVLDLLHQVEYVDETPYTCYYRWLTEYGHLASVSTIYRILKENDETKRRGRSRSPVSRQPPIVWADAVNQVWCWDITLVPGPLRGLFYYLYIIIALFSRYVIAWTCAPKERAFTGQHLIREAFRREQAQIRELVIHSDRGNPMIAKKTQVLLDTLNIKRSYSRPRVSDDNPFIEALNKTLKYDSTYPDFFLSEYHVKQWMTPWVHTYHHRPHRGLNGFTPHQAYTGSWVEVQSQRTTALASYYQVHPERFGKPPVQKPIPALVGINLHTLEILDHGPDDIKIIDPTSLSPGHTLFGIQ